MSRGGDFPDGAVHERGAMLKLAAILLILLPSIVYTTPSDFDRVSYCVSTFSLEHYYIKWCFDLESKSHPEMHFFFIIHRVVSFILMCKNSLMNDQIIYGKVM